MSDPASTPPDRAAAPSWLRFVRIVVIALLALALSFLGLLNAVTSMPVIRESLGPLVWEQHADSGPAIVITLLVAFLVPIGAMIFGSRRGWLRWPQLGLLATFILITFVYLGWDDPAVRRPLTMDELAPPLPGDEATNALALRYAKNSAAAKAFKPPKDYQDIAVATGDIATKPEKWAVFLREHRAAVETGWAEIAAVHAWWEEMAAQPRLGDLTPPRPDASIPAFQPIRTHSQYAVTFAGLQAIEGHGDEAMTTLTHLYSAARKLEPTSRTLVRLMIAKVIQRMAIQTAVFVLDHATVSPAARAAFVAELDAAVGGAPGARRLVLLEYAYFGPILKLFASGEGAIEGTARERILVHIVHTLGCLVVNPRATQNLVGDRYYARAALAEERRFGELEATKGPIDRDLLDGYHVKNLGGRLIGDMAMPALSKVVKSYWDIDDLRVAMIKQLKAKP